MALRYSSLNWYRFIFAGKRMKGMGNGKTYSQVSFIWTVVRHEGDPSKGGAFYSLPRLHVNENLGWKGANQHRWKDQKKRQGEKTDQCNYDIENASHPVLVETMDTQKERVCSIISKDGKKTNTHRCRAWTSLSMVKLEVQFFAITLWSRGCLGLVLC